MATRPILTYDQPVLRTKASAITRFDDELKRLVEDMWETMRSAHGVGLAAPQIGESIRVLVAAYEHQAIALVNPQITKMSEEERLGSEGCLSIPGLIGDRIRRKAWIIVDAQDIEGKPLHIRADEWFARVLQHEIDHLDGILYVDRLDAITDLRRKSVSLPAEEPEPVEAPQPASAAEEEPASAAASAPQATVTAPATSPATPTRARATAHARPLQSEHALPSSVPSRRTGARKPKVPMNKSATSHTSPILTEGAETPEAGAVLSGAHAKRSSSRRSRD